METSEEFKSYFALWQEKTGAFLSFDWDANPSGSSDSILSGLPFAVKDNLAVKNHPLTCASRLLQNFTSTYTASAVQKLEEAGAVPVGKTNMDEFGMGSSTDASALQKTNNPYDTSRVAGGSSGGSAAAVSAGLTPFALGSDTGGSIRQPAAFCGVAGLKPTYGAVSRYGLVAYASSLDTVGVLAKNISLCREAFNVIKGACPKDQTSRNAPPIIAKNERADGCKGVIGVISPLYEHEGEQAGAQAVETEEETNEGFKKAKERFRDLGYKLVDVEIPALKYCVPAYYTIAAAEASANLARFDGVRYGKRPDWAENHEELVSQARSLGFGDEVKLRILLGTFVLRSGFQDRYYLRAQRIRGEIRKKFEELLGDETQTAPAPCDALLSPVFPRRAFGRGEKSLSPFMQKTADVYTCPANLAGLPALSFPASLEGGLPVGAQIIGRAFNEERLFHIASDYEAAHPFPRPRGYKDFWK
ncbi:MAG: aspartyl/glutamyl-tRNA amidotransferase subunit A [Spirochaetaceae bacterium]|jgi:aspartyl-tRNA(Asn)/glutamyl-tRNA(Gln) amidotransferase subunit A|nr:aspartyl/glutamyl-tRNA amidotransferase subunit A [Spirochaetaceae bacterium]